MNIVPATCPVCQTPAGAQETACANCGLVFGSQVPASGTSPPPPAALPPTPCPQCAQPAPVGALVCGACGASLIYTYAALKPSQSLAKGRYTVQRALSKGGMGAIYLATDHEAFDRIVVVKAMLDYFDPTDPQAIQAARERFLHEARTLSTLRHPAIPQIFTYFQDGPHNYIVMEYVEGYDLEQRLTRRNDARGRIIRGRPYPQTDVLRWGMALCRVLEYLASRTPNPVVHHDIKPANLLLDSGSGDIRLVDFGTAKARLLVQTGGGGLQKSSIHGTQGYAAPEQYRGESEARSDVYALAATLYHLATDDDPRDHPFDFPQLKTLGAFGQVLRAALNPDVAQRPGAATLYRLLESLLVLTSARPLEAPDGTELTDVLTLAIWCEQNWPQAASWLYGKLPDQIELWWGQTRLARDLRALVDQHKNEPSAGLDAAIALLDPRGFGMAAPRLVSNAPALHYGRLTPRSQESQSLVIENISRRHVRATVALPPWLSSSPTTKLSLPPGDQMTLQLTAYGSRLTVGGRVRDLVILNDEIVKLLEVVTQTFISRWWRLLMIGRATLRYLPRTIAVVGALFALVMCCSGGRIIQPAVQQVSQQVEMGRYTAGVAAMERGDWAAAARELDAVPGSYQDTEARRRESYYQLGQAALDRQDWQAARQALFRVPSHPGAQALLRQVDRREAEHSGLLAHWVEIAPNSQPKLCLSPDGRMYSQLALDNTIRLHRVRDNALIQTFVGHTTGVSMVALSPDGHMLASGSQNGVIKIWQVSDGALLTTIDAHSNQITGLAFSPDNRTLASSSMGTDEGLRIWRVRDGAPAQHIDNQPGFVSRFAFSADGQLLATNGADSAIRLWRLADSKLIWTHTTPNGIRPNMALSPATQALAMTNGYTKITLWNPENNTALRSFGEVQGATESMAFSPDGQLLAQANRDGMIRLWRVGDGTLLQTYPRQSAPPQYMAFDLDGNLVAASEEVGTLIVWRVAQ